MEIQMSRGDIEEVQRTITQGMDLNRPVFGKETLFDLAADRGNFEIQKLLMKAGAKIPDGAIMEAVRNSNLEAVKYFVGQGLAVNYVVPDSGFTPLMLAVSGGSIPIAEYLVSQGADRTAVNKW